MSTDSNFNVAVISKYGGSFRQEIQRMVHDFEDGLLRTFTAHERLCMEEMAYHCTGVDEHSPKHICGQEAIDGACQSGEKTDCDREETSCVSRQNLLNPEAMHTAPPPPKLADPSVADLSCFDLQVRDDEIDAKATDDGKTVAIRDTVCLEEYQQQRSLDSGDHTVSQPVFDWDPHGTTNMNVNSCVQLRDSRPVPDELSCHMSRNATAVTARTEVASELTVANSREPSPMRISLGSQLLEFWVNGLSDSFPSYHISKTSEYSTFMVKNPSSRTRSNMNVHLRDLVQNPTSTYRIVWDLIAAALLMFDWFYIPFVLLSPPWTLFTNVTWVISITYWTLDIPPSFFTGFQKDGTLETRVSLTVKRYLRTWCLPDIALLTLDFSLFVVHLGDDANKPSTETSFRALRGLRVFRIMRLLRILKMRGFFNQAFELITSEYVRTLLKVGRNLCLVLAINHVVACFWFFIGVPIEGESYEKAYADQGWMINLMTRPGPYQTVNLDTGGTIELAKIDIRYFYFTALHWSLTQFTPASMEVFPTTTFERLYTVCVLVFAMVSFSTFISSITQAMTTIRIIADERESRNQSLRRYFRDQGVAPAIQMRIWRHVEQLQNKMKKRQVWPDVQSLLDLPDILRIELQHEVFGKRLSLHPVFFYFQEMTANGFRSICHRCLEESHLRCDDLLFAHATAADGMYFLHWGMLKYHKLDEEKRHEKIMGAIVKDNWCCENTLWIKWSHAGTMSASVASIVMALDRSEFLDVVRRYPDTFPPLKMYAEAFASFVNDNKFHSITDLPIDIDETHDMIFSSVKAYQCGLANPEDVARRASDEFNKASGRTNSSGSSGRRRGLLGRIRDSFRTLSEPGE